jgi:hypothetical protein
VVIKTLQIIYLSEIPLPAFDKEEIKNFLAKVSKTTDKNSDVLLYIYF